MENDIKNNIMNNEKDIIELPSQSSLIKENDIIKLQRVDKFKKRCSSCGRLRVIKNKELGLCSICDSAKKYWGAKNEVRNDNNVVDVKHNDIKVEDKTIDDKVEAVTFYCDVCNNKVLYAQRKCHKCQSLLNWLNTDLEKDDNYLICGVCGAILDLNSEKCFNCGSA